MVFVTRTKPSMERGIQTYARVKKLPDEYQELELKYLNVRDAYMGRLAIIAQFVEELKAARAENDNDRIRELGARIRQLEDALQGERQKLYAAACSSFGHIFMEVAEALLTKEAFRAIEAEVEAILRRPKNELTRS